MFIAFDGIDGSGKTTLATMLFNAFSEKGYTVELYDMGNFGVIDDYLSQLKNRKERIPAELRELLFYLEGKLFSEYVEANETKVIITDRYLLTYYAYGPINGIEQEHVKKITQTMKKPNYYFFLDVCPEDALKRISKYRKIDPPEVGYAIPLSDDEKVNQKNYLKAQTKIYENYNLAIKNTEMNIHRIDGTQEPTAAFERILSIIQKDMR